MENKRHETVIPTYTPAELLALSLLCEDWARHYMQAPLSASEWRNRIVQLRRGVIAGYGKREDVPAELVQCDYRTTVIAVVHLREKIKSGLDPSREDGQDSVPYQLGGRAYRRCVIWELTLLDEIKKKFLDGRSSDASIARIIVAKRLTIPKKTIDQAIRDNGLRRRQRTNPMSAINPSETRARLNPGWDLAVSTLIDLIAGRNTRKCIVAQMQILQSLAATRMSRIYLFYLAQLLQTVPRTEGLVAGPDLDVSGLCKALSPNRKRSFTNLNWPAMLAGID